MLQMKSLIILLLRMILLAKAITMDLVTESNSIIFSMNESLYSVQLIRVYEKNPEQLKELIASEEEPSLSDLIQVRKRTRLK